MNTATNYQIRRLSSDSLLVISQANVQEPDLDFIDEQLWEEYLKECKLKGLQASYKDYLVWREELAGEL